jgi:hypothetical protein
MLKPFAKLVNVHVGNVFGISSSARINSAI